MGEEGKRAWPNSLLNGSEMGRRIREFDWSGTPLGAIESWPQSLRDHVGMLVDNDFAMYILWGAEHIALYNDAYIPMAGEKHPHMLGMPTADVWREVWADIEALVMRAKHGDPVTLQDLELTIVRRGFPEEFYCTFCYSPLREESGDIAGVLATVTETTARVFAHRRLETLRELAFQTSTALTEAETIARVAGVLERSADLKFAFVYLADEGSPAARLAAEVKASARSLGMPEDVHLTDAQPAAEVFGGDAILTAAIGAPERHRSIGMLVAGVPPRLRADDAYREFVTLIASQIGSSIAAARAFVEERSRAESMQVTRTIEKIGLFADSGQQLFWTARADGSIDWYNRGWYEYTGQTFEEAKGWGWMAAHHPRDLDDVMRRWPESLARRAPFDLTFRLRGKDGRYRWFLTRAVPELTDDGKVVRWYGTSTNIDSERRAAQQLDFFAGLGDRLVQAPGKNGALRALADGLVPTLADWTLINLADEHGDLVVSLAHHRDPEQLRLLQPFIGTHYVGTGDTVPAAVEVFKTGKPVLMESADGAIARGRVADDFAEAIVSVGMRSLVVVPIVANGVIFGTFHAIATEADKIYTERDVPFFEEIGRRMGFALQNAQAYERKSKIAHAFQSAALPVGLPDVPGLCFSSLYEPASHEANVGGDFYDAFRLLDGRVVLSIGDVAGAGLGAAATMAALRQSIRAVASVNPDPEMLLKAADDVFSDAGRAPFASAFVAVIDPLAFSVQYANAGHPPPMLRRPDGSVTMLEGKDLLLGVTIGNHYGARRVGKILVEPGSLLVLYTDGLTEATRDLLEGERRLRDAIATTNCAMDSASQTARDVWRRVIEGGAPHDDVAVMTLFFDTPLLQLGKAGVFCWSFDSQDATAAHAVRNEAVRLLHECGARSEDVFAAQMIFSELVGNVFRHAGTRLDLVLDLTQKAAVLHVLDEGGGFSLNPKLPLDAYAERGRGLYIVRQLARELTVSPRTISRGSHARAVLPGSIVWTQRSPVALRAPLPQTPSTGEKPLEPLRR